MLHFRESIHTLTPPTYVQGVKIPTPRSTFQTSEAQTVDDEKWLTHCIFECVLTSCGLLWLRPRGCRVQSAPARRRDGSWRCRRAARMSYHRQRSTHAPAYDHAPRSPSVSLWRRSTTERHPSSRTAPVTTSWNFLSRTQFFDTVGWMTGRTSRIPKGSSLEDFQRTGLTGSNLRKICWLNKSRK